MARRARIISMEWQFSVTWEKMKEIATKIVGMMDFLKFVILWNWFKKRHCSILSSKKQCQNFWSLKSWVLKKHLGYQPFCSWTRVLFSETASKTTLFHLEFKKKRCQNFWSLKSWVLKKHLGYQPFCSWTRVLSSETASKPTLFHLEFQKNSVNFFWSLKSGALKNHLGFNYNFW